MMEQKRGEMAKLLNQIAAIKRARSEAIFLLFWDVAQLLAREEAASKP